MKKDLKWLIIQKIKATWHQQKTIADLTEKGFDVFIPVVSEHLPFDLIGYKDNKFYRFQVKYRENGFVSDRTVWTDKHGNHITKYLQSDFDYYAIYLPDRNAVCYPSISFAGCTLKTELPNSSAPFYWYEDFLDLTDTATKRTYHEFGYELTSKGHTKKPNSGLYVPREQCRKVIRPSKEELEKLLYQYPMIDLSKQFGVYDKAIAKWAKNYGIKVPGRGYWQTQKSIEPLSLVPQVGLEPT